MRFVLLGLAIATGLAISCKDEDPRPPITTTGAGTPTGGAGIQPGSDAGTRTDASTTDGGVCNDLTHNTASIDEESVNGDPPAVQPSTISDGTYDLVNAILYVGASGTPGVNGVTYSMAIRIAAGRFDRVTKTTGGADQFQSGTISVQSTSATITFNCPTSAVESVTYSSNGNSLILTNVATKEALTFNLRQ